jgi:spore germination protein Q
MNNNPANYYANGQDYYNFPAYRAVVGNTVAGMPPQQGQGMQASYPPMSRLTAPPSGTPIQGGPTTLPAPATPGLLPLEQSYIENILRLNLGKIGTFYMTYENNTQWNAKIFKGKIEAAGRDHIVLSDPKTGMRYLLLMVNLDYVTFDEELKYTSPYQTGSR